MAGFIYYKLFLRKTKMKKRNRTVIKSEIKVRLDDKINRVVAHDLQLEKNEPELDRALRVAFGDDEAGKELDGNSETRGVPA